MSICVCYFVAKDMIEVCLAVEVFWFVIVIVFRPYSGISEHSLSAGNALILIISNATLLYYKNNDLAKLSFALSIVFVVLACLPTILSLYLFFIFDFDFKPTKEDQNIVINTAVS